MCSMKINLIILLFATITVYSQINSVSGGIIDGVEIPSRIPIKTIQCFSPITELLWSKTDTSSTHSNTLKLIGVLENDVFPQNCGSAIISIPGKFRIKEYNDTLYSNDKIVVIFICPGDYQYDKLKKGKTYELILSNNKNTPYGNPIESSMTKEEIDIIQNFNNGKLVWAVEWGEVRK